MKLRGKVAIVTGSTDGIGFAIAKKFVQEGCNVVVCSRRKQNVDRAFEQLEPFARQNDCQVLALQCDVLAPANLHTLVDQTIAKFAKIDILVANAAANPVYGKGLMDIDEMAYDATFDANVKSVWQLSKLVVPHMKQQRGGSLIFVSSTGAYMLPTFLGVYAVSKAALISLSKCMASQLGKFNIRVNAIAVGLIETRFSTSLRSDSNITKVMLSRYPMGRFGKPDECAGAALFLASDDSSFISGEAIVIAGGNPAHF